jgi:hypothetical protein
MQIQIESSILELFLPEGTLEWFDLVKGERDTEKVRITLEEKNIPPVPSQHKGKQILSKGFFDITITDFPIRGRRGVYTFRRRRWQVEGEKKILKRDIKLTFPGTQLEQEFAAFLKEDGGYQTSVTSFNSNSPEDTR